MHTIGLQNMSNNADMGSSRYSIDQKAWRTLPSATEGEQREMSTFQKPNIQAHRRRATELVPAAHTLSIAALQSLRKQFQEARVVDEQAWDFCATIAAVTGACWFL